MSGYENKLKYIADYNKTRCKRFLLTFNKVHDKDIIEKFLSGKERFGSYAKYVRYLTSLDEEK